MLWPLGREQAAFTNSTPIPKSYREIWHINTIDQMVFSWYRTRPTRGWGEGSTLGPVQDLISCKKAWSIPWGQRGVACRALHHCCSYPGASAGSDSSCHTSLDVKQHICQSAALCLCFNKPLYPKTPENRTHQLLGQRALSYFLFKMPLGRGKLVNRPCTSTETQAWPVPGLFF